MSFLSWFLACFKVSFQQVWWHLPGRCTRCNHPQSIHLYPCTWCHCRSKLHCVISVLWMFDFLAACCPQTGGKRKKENKKGVAQDEGWKTFTLPRFQYKWITNRHMIETLLDSSEAVKMQSAAKHICVFTWVSLRTWPGTAITATSGYALGMH